MKERGSVNRRTVNFSLKSSPFQSLKNFLRLTNIKIHVHAAFAPGIRTEEKSLPHSLRAFRRSHKSSN